MPLNRSQNKRVLAPALLIESKKRQLSQLHPDTIAIHANRVKEDISCSSFEQKDHLIQWLAVVATVIDQATGLTLHQEQLAGAYWLSRGRVIDMATGEGKTLVGIMAASYLSILYGKTYIMTANSHLAERDSVIAKKCLSALNIKASHVSRDMTLGQKQDSYTQNDIVYGTAQQFGFDYLRDQMVLVPEDHSGALMNSLIVDEIDAILIDDGKTPLILAKEGGYIDEDEFKNAIDWANSAKISVKHSPEKGDSEDCSVDAWHYRDGKRVELTSSGFRSLEKYYIEKGMLSQPEDLYLKNSLSKVHLAHLAVQATHACKKDVDYIVEGSEVIIIERHTGRAMPGRRWSGGLHQLVEAKENVPIRNENIAASIISLQALIALFQFRCGMSGSAKIAREVLKDDYGLDVTVIPPHASSRRVEHQIRIAKNKSCKIKAIVETAVRASKNGQPVLLGTDTISSTIEISKEFDALKIPHRVLNAKSSSVEAEIISKAGHPGVITIATHMAGRGTDIVLDDFAISRGGLLVISAEPHEDRRLDVQLMGRAARQGQPGEYVAYCSPDDELFKRAGDKEIRRWIAKISLADDEIASHPDVDKMVAKAQIVLESKSQRARKELFEKEYIISQQRNRFYDLRRHWLLEDISPTFDSLIRKAIKSIVRKHCSLERIKDHWYLEDLHYEIYTRWGIDVTREELDLYSDPTDIEQLILCKLNYRDQLKESSIRRLMLKVLDLAWECHLQAIEEIEINSILQAYAQKSPRLAFNQLALLEFGYMLKRIPGAILDALLEELDLSNSNWYNMKQSEAKES